MDGCLTPLGDESVLVPGIAAKRLLEKGDGDAALLYLALLRHRGAVQPRALAGELRWERTRIEAAEAVLRELKLVTFPAAELPEPADEKPQYSQEDVVAALEQDLDFQGLTAEVERTLGKKLSTQDLKTLLGLYDYVGLPPDVLYLLVCHCLEIARRSHGPGGRPTLRQIEKEGYAWARMGLDTQTAAAAYLKKYAQRQERLPGYMGALQLGSRLPAPAEERYLIAWQEWGFGPEEVAAAYDKTMLKCHELKWPYLNGILKKWHEAGLHTLSEITAGDRARKGGEDSPAQETGSMRKYVEDLHRNRT